MTVSSLLLLTLQKTDAHISRPPMARRLQSPRMEREAIDLREKPTYNSNRVYIAELSVNRDLVLYIRLITCMWLILPPLTCTCGLSENRNRMTCIAGQL